MNASQGTSDGQDHERIQRAGQERDASGHLPDGEAAGFMVNGRRLCYSSTVATKVFQTNYKRDNEFLLRQITSLQPSNRPVMRTRTKGFSLYYVSVMQRTVSDKLIMHNRTCT